MLDEVVGLEVGVAKDFGVEAEGNMGSGDRQREGS